MGVHLILRKRGSYDEHAGWRDSHQMANGGHKHFARNVLRHLPKEDVKTSETDYDFDWLMRPTDFAAWRAAIAADPQISGDNSNLLALVDILEQEPDYWLYVSQ